MGQGRNSPSIDARLRKAPCGVILALPANLRAGPQIPLDRGKPSHRQEADRGGVPAGRCGIEERPIDVDYAHKRLDVADCRI